MKKLKQLTQKEKIFVSLKCVGKSARKLTEELGISRMAFNVPVPSPYIEDDLWKKIEDNLGFEIKTGYEGLSMDFHLGNKIKALLYLEGLNNIELSKKIGRSAKDINDKLSGKSELRLDIIRDIAHIVEADFYQGFKGKRIDTEPLEDKLKDVVASKGLFLNKIAEQIGIAQQTISFKTTNNTFTLSEIKAISEILDEEFIFYIEYGNIKIL